MQLIEVHEGIQEMARAFIEGRSVATGLKGLDVPPIHIFLDSWRPLWCFASTDVNLSTISWRYPELIWDINGENDADYLSFSGGSLSHERLERFPGAQRSSELFWTDYLGFNNKEL